MHVGEALVARARASGKRSIAVVGTAKNVGKTVTVIALIDALERSGTPFGVASIGRDGEAVDALEGTSKPRVRLRAGTLFATAVALLPSSPAVEILEDPGVTSAVGRIVLARTAHAGTFELAGPPSASALRTVVDRLFAHGAETVVIDGAIDRLAALRQSDAIVVATGSAAGPTPSRVVEEAADLIACLQLPAVDPDREALEIDGALTTARATELLRCNEKRQIVVREPTRIVAGGRTFAALRAQLDLRCERTFHPIACTVAPSGGGRSFEPSAFLRAMAGAVNIPCYDVYAGAQA